MYPSPTTTPRPRARTYEEYAYVLGPTRRGRSHAVRSKDGLIVTSVGESRFALLELLGDSGSAFQSGERLRIGRGRRTKVTMVLGKIPYERLTEAARRDLPGVVLRMVSDGEKRFVDYLNTAGPISHRVHALELIPGIGKTYMNAMLDERERRKFESYADLQERVGLSSPVEHIAERIVSEMRDRGGRMNMFVKG